jgi:predicted metal-dependent peptidase
VTGIDDTAASVYAHRGTRAVQRMVEYAPSTGSLALWIRHRDVDAIAVAGGVLACNDGTNIRYAPGFESLPLARQTGLVAHQVLHVALRHAPRFIALQRQLGDVDIELYNICADAIVNSALSHLAWLELGPHAVLLEKLLAKSLNVHVDAERALLDWDLERLYRAIDDRTARRRQQDPRGKKGSESAGSKQADDSSQTPRRSADGPRSLSVRVMGRHSPRDLVPDLQASQPESEAEQAREWHERILRGHAGDGALSMLRALLADLPKVHTPWEQLLRTRLARGLSVRPALSWSRPARSYIANRGRLPGGRRMPWEPGWTSGRRVARLAIMVDVSGSVDNALLQRFAAEIAAITRRLEAGAVLIIGDNRVRKVVHFEPGRTDLDGVECQGGGGTDFTPLLEEADRWRPDIGVFLTDLEGPANHRPAFPVIWAVPLAQADAYHPFGTKLVLQ